MDQEKPDRNLHIIIGVWLAWIMIALALNLAFVFVVLHFVRKLW